MAKQIPVIGEWYQDAAQDVLFEVVAVDEDSATIEIQFEDGEVDEYDFDSWMQMVVLSAHPPEDWRVSYGLTDDFDSDDIQIPDSLDDPLTTIEPDSLWGLDDY